MRYANLNGHDHTYERFAPQTPSGELDGGGLRQFIVANGGKSRSACHRRAHREVANAKLLRGAAATAEQLREGRRARGGQALHRLGLDALPLGHVRGARGLRRAAVGDGRADERRADLPKGSGGLRLRWVFVPLVVALLAWVLPLALGSAAGSPGGSGGGGAPAWVFVSYVVSGVALLAFIALLCAWVALGRRRR
jgi:hypothetical protein